MKLAELAGELKISPDTIKKFIQDFELDVDSSISTSFDVKEDFEKFARENIEFLKKYEDDLNKEKSAEDIAKTIRRPVEKVREEIKKEVPNLYESGVYKSSVSSFGIDNKLGGNYQFVYDYFGDEAPLTHKDFIGYRDLFFYISDELEPFISPESAKNWGIKKPSGIVLYGPPGCGKIFWANKISEIIGYKFKEVKKHYFGTSFVDGNKVSFNDFLITIMKEDNVLLFVEDFDELMMDRSRDTSVTSETDETKDIILHYIEKFEKEDLLMVGAANSLYKIDEEVLAPGRFDVLIPIFPPNQQERTEMLLYYMTENLEKNSLLFRILENNSADHLPFWQSISERMKVYSNTMIIDFTQSLKRRIKNRYQKTKNLNLTINTGMLDGVLKEVSTKLTDEYLNQLSQFIREVSENNLDDFAQRIDAIKAELDTHRIREKPTRAIGFHHNKKQS